MGRQYQEPTYPRFLQPDVASAPGNGGLSDTQLVVRNGRLVRGPGAVPDTPIPSHAQRGPFRASSWRQQAALAGNGAFSADGTLEAGGVLDRVVIKEPEDFMLHDIEIQAYGGSNFSTCAGTTCNGGCSFQSCASTCGSCPGQNTCGGSTCGSCPGMSCNTCGSACPCV